jgi:hypothetical protein
MFFMLGHHFILKNSNKERSKEIVIFDESTIYDKSTLRICSI